MYITTMYILELFNGEFSVYYLSCDPAHYDIIAITIHMYVYMSIQCDV